MYPNMCYHADSGDLLQCCSPCRCLLPISGAALASVLICMGPANDTTMSSATASRHKAWLAPYTMPQYSASPEDGAIVDWLVLDDLVTCPARIGIPPDVQFLPPLQSAKSVLVQTTRLSTASGKAYWLMYFGHPLRTLRSSSFFLYNSDCV